MSAADAMGRRQPIFPPISREAHERLVAEAVAKERERIAEWLEEFRMDSGPAFAALIRDGEPRGNR